MKVATKSKSQPAPHSAHNRPRKTAVSTSHTTCGMGRHSRQSGASTTQVARTKVLRSAATGRKRVIHALNGPRAMIVCWIANAAIRARSMATATPTGAALPRSTLGYATSTTKPRK